MHRGQRFLWQVLALAAALLTGCQPPNPTADRPASVAEAPSGARSIVEAPQEPEPPPPKARFTRQIDWIGRGVWLKADTHTHTKFSDGSFPVDAIVAKAAEYGCDVIAITDHSDRNLTAATPPYIEAIQSARKQHPDMIVLAGVEWNVPPWDGDEHACVILPTSDDEGRILAEFKALFDDLDRDMHETALADQGIAWLAEHGRVGDVPPAVVYNHPSRKREQSTDIVDEMKRLRGLNDIVTAIEGGPGHQRSKTLGSYTKTVKLVDRWDPVVAEIGGAWDQLLGAGIDVWGVVATSDVHNGEPRKAYDCWPGELAETWLYAPDRSAPGVIRALRAGSFFGAHGHIAREVSLTVDAADLPRAAHAGEAIAVQPATKLHVRLTLQTPMVDWQGLENRIDEVELIAISGAGAQSLVIAAPQSEGAVLDYELEAPAEGVVLRARGRRVIADRDDLLFYTNPIRISVEYSATTRTRLEAKEAGEG